MVDYLKNKLFEIGKQTDSVSSLVACFTNSIAFPYHNELSVKITFRGIFHIRIDASGALIEYLFVLLYVVVTGITVISLLTSRMFPVTVKIIVTYVHANDHVIECGKILVSFWLCNKMCEAYYRLLVR